MSGNFGWYTGDASSDCAADMLLMLATAGAALGLAVVQEQRGEASNEAAHIPREPVQKLSGRDWIEANLHNEKRCKENFRMNPESLVRLHGILCTDYGLRSTREMSSIESLALFVWTCAKNASVRDAKDRFESSPGTISKKMTEMAEVFARFADNVIVPFDQTYSSVHIDLQKWEPYFDGCIGAMDGTHVKVITKRTSKLDYTNRKGVCSVNVLAICDMDRRFTFVGAGMAGSCHDAFVFSNCENKPNFPHPPEGRYYLVDSGYAKKDGYMGPYTRTRYHLDQFKGVPEHLLNVEEYFNLVHSRLRNVVERTFGILKKRWRILEQVPFYEREKQVQIIIGCFALNNYLWECDNGTRPSGTYPLSRWVEENKDTSTETLRDYIKFGLAANHWARYAGTAVQEPSDGVDGDGQMVDGNMYATSSNGVDGFGFTSYEETDWFEGAAGQGWSGFDGYAEGSAGQGWSPFDGYYGGGGF